MLVGCLLLNPAPWFGMGCGDSLNFKTFGSDYYEQKFPGFDEDVYRILADSTKDENKVIDTRSPPLKISHEETTLKFD